MQVTENILLPKIVNQNGIFKCIIIRTIKDCTTLFEFWMPGISLGFFCAWRKSVSFHLWKYSSSNPAQSALRYRDIVVMAAPTKKREIQLENENIEKNNKERSSSDEEYDSENENASAAQQVSLFIYIIQFLTLFCRLKITNLNTVTQACAHLSRIYMYIYFFFPIRRN